MIESIECMRKLVNDNLVMGLRFQMNRELDKLEREISEHEDRLQAQADELTAERDKLKELNGYHATQYELASEDCDMLQAQVDRLTAERDNLKANNEQLYTLAGEQAAKIDVLADERYRYKLQCERYEAKIAELNTRLERTCSNIAEYTGEFKCSECGAIWRIENEACESILIVDGIAEYPYYCPHCGRKVMGE